MLQIVEYSMMTYIILNMTEIMTSSPLYKLYTTVIMIITAYYIALKLPFEIPVYKIHTRKRMMHLKSVFNIPVCLISTKTNAYTE